MAVGTIAIGATTLDTPVGYTPKFIEAKTRQRAIRGNMIINYSVTEEDQPIDKYIFEITDVVNSKLRDLEAEARYTGNLDYVDYIQITERLSGDGSTKTFYTLRRFNTKTAPVPTITVDDVSKSPTITMDDSGRGKLVFTDAPSNNTGNIKILYEPKYLVNIADYYRTGKIKDVAIYTLICEEV